MKTLVIVDLQKDFCYRTGALYVEGAESLPTRISKRIKEGGFDNIIITLDSHPLNHCSFVDNGGQWPKHCVKGTEGASVPQKIFDVISNLEHKPDIVIIEKGCDSDKEEYGAFTGYNRFNNPFKYFFSCNTERDIYDMLKESEDIEVVGIAGDYCVLNTIKEMLKFLHSEQIYVNINGVKSIDDGTTLDTFCKENDIACLKM